MYRAPLMLVLLVLLAPATIADPMWATLVQDASGDASTAGVAAPLDPNADLRTIQAKQEGDTLYLRVTSGNATAAEDTRYASILRFAYENASTRERRHFEIHHDERGLRLLENGRTIGGHTLITHEGDAPYAYTIGMVLTALAPGGAYAAGDRITGVSASLRSEPAGLPPTTDHAPDFGSGDDYVLASGQDGTISPSWRTITGMDFAAAPSIATGPDGALHLAYIVYNEDRGTREGVYHALLRSGSIDATRIGDVQMPAKTHQDKQTATSIAVDRQGAVHVLYHPQPGDTSAGVAYATNQGGTWRVEEVRAGDDASLTFATDVRAIPAIGASSDRVVAALQTEDEGLAVLEREADGWSLVQAIAHARHGRLVLDSQGHIHLAWFQPDSDESPNRGVYGPLMYASERDGWKSHRIAEGIEDLSKFRGQSEVDGTFAFALAPDDTPHFVWEGQREERGYTILGPDGPRTTSTPLVPDHGNPQDRMRMVIDHDGNSHIVSGYGGADLYAMRTPDGRWYKESIPRLEMFGIALTSEGHPAVVHTQPHGGTTLGVFVATTSATAAEGTHEPIRVGPLGLLEVPATPAMAIAALAAAVLMRRRFS